MLRGTNIPVMIRQATATRTTTTGMTSNAMMHPAIARTITMIMATNMIMPRQRPCARIATMRR